MTTAAAILEGRVITRISDELLRGYLNGDPVEYPRLYDVMADLAAARNLLDMLRQHPVPQFEQWTAVEDGLPPEDNKLKAEMYAVLTRNEKYGHTCYDTSEWICTDKYANDWQFFEEWNSEGWYVTHWMPLPPLPQEAQDER